MNAPFCFPQIPPCSAKLHDTQATSWCLTDCKSPKGVPYLSSYSKNSYSISSWCMLQQCDGRVETPTGAYGRLFTPAASWSLFPASSVCSCRPGELSSAARRAGCSVLLAHLTALRGMHLESTLPNQYEIGTNVLLSHEEFDVLLQLIISQLSLNRIHRNLSPPLSHEMPLWHKTICTNQRAGISPGCGFDRPEEWSLQGSGWHSALHRCACIICWVFWVNVNEYEMLRVWTRASDIYKCPAESCWACTRKRPWIGLFVLPSLLMKCSVLFEQLSLLCFLLMPMQYTVFHAVVLVNPSYSVLF